MKTRVDKNNIEETSSMPPKRVAKNTKLYEEIKNSELSDFDIASNAKVIGESDSRMDINKIKEILEKNYQDPPKRRSVKFDIPEEEEIELEKTREYDINTILEEARQEKEVDYEQERLKKIRDTQYDILKNLELEKETKTTSEKNKEELLELINTINLNELEKKTKLALEQVPDEEEEEEDLNPLNILSDLKGDDNTVVAGAKELQEKITQKEKEEEKEPEDETKLDDSFYTNSMSFSKKDFADFDDLEDKRSSIVIKILIVVVILAIIAGVVVFLNEFLELGWF